MYLWSTPVALKLESSFIVNPAKSKCFQLDGSVDSVLSPLFPYRCIFFSLGPCFVVLGIIAVKLASPILAGFLGWSRLLWNWVLGLVRGG